MKTLWSIALISFLCFHSLGQSIDFGMKGGLNIADIVINNTTTDPDGESDFNLKPGIHAGVFANADVGERVGLGAELLYSVKGVKAINNINLHYVVLPLLVRYSLGEKFIAEAGPEIGYLVATSSPYGNVNSTYDNKLDIGLDFGLQYNITNDFTLGMRFNAGISSVIKNPQGASQPENAKFQNRVLQISLGYTLFRYPLNHAP